MADGLLARFLSTAAPEVDAGAGGARLFRRRAHELNPGEVYQRHEGRLERWQLIASSWEAREIAAELLPLLGEDAGFLDPAELKEFLDHCVRVAEEDLDAKYGIEGYVQFVREAIYRELDDGAGLFKFEVGVPIDGFLVTPEAWGETRQFRVSGNAVSGALPLVLQGETVARTSVGAHRKAEDTVKAFVGAAYSLGILGYLPALDGCVPSWSTGWAAPVDGACSVTITPVDDRALNAPPQENLDASPGLRAALHGIVGAYPRDLSELESTQLKANHIGAALGRRVRALKGVMVGASEASEGMRSLCGLACAAASTDDPGISLSLAFSVVEGLLLDPSQDSDVQARLREAVAYLLGTTSQDRKRLRLRVHELYRLRSRFMHRGGRRPTVTSRDQGLELMRAVLRRELEVLAENEAG